MPIKRAKFTLPQSGEVDVPKSPGKEGEKEVGYVIKTQDYIVVLEGLPSAKLYNIVVTKNGGRALVSALEKDRVEALMLDSERPKPGDYFELSDAGLRIPLNVDLFGRMINPLGMPLDGKASLPPGGETLDLDSTAPGIDGRAPVNEQFYTGITVVDTLLPIGKGQRELIMCEPRSGKEQFFLDVILSQKDQDRVCVYAAVGRSELEVKRFSEDIHAVGADKYTIILAATSSESAPMIQIAPSVAASLAEYYRDKGRHVLLIIDDLATHAKYAREISLLAGRIPGRESYPADIFYQHSSIVERAGMFNDHFHDGSITMLPTIETNIENFTNLIPTNVMSMTDGHILFSANLRAQGIYPAIEPDRSVTRVGRQTQTFIHKVLSDRVRGMLADYHELERYGRFGSELSAETQLKIKRGKVFEELLKQEQQFSIPPEVQILMLSLVFAGFFDSKDLEFVKSHKQKVIETLKSSVYKPLVDATKTAKLDELITQLKGQLKSIEEATKDAVDKSKVAAVPAQAPPKPVDPVKPPETTNVKPEGGEKKN
jgi:F-type H+/Na+-transporting ATPase subunit alpha